MRQKLILERAPFIDRFAEEEDEVEVMEDKLNEATPWELAFERGVEQANKEMFDEWSDEDEFE